MIGDWEKKVWGHTRCVISSQRYSRHELKLIQGGFCSLHLHHRRANLFKVETGVVRIVRCYAWRLRADILSAGNELTIPPLIPHQFQVLEAGTMVEEYFPRDIGALIDLADIERLTTGGCNYDSVKHSNSIILSDGTLWNHGDPS